MPARHSTQVGHVSQSEPTRERDIACGASSAGGGGSRGVGARGAQGADVASISGNLLGIGASGAARDGRGASSRGAGSYDDAIKASSLKIKGKEGGEGGEREDVTKRKGQINININIDKRYVKARQYDKAQKGRTHLAAGNAVGKDACASGDGDDASRLGDSRGSCQGGAPDGASKQGAEVSEDAGAAAMIREGSPEAGQAWSWE